MSTSISIPTTPSSPPFQPIAQVLERGLSIAQVYGEPVRQGDVTVIPVAKVAFGFGAGVGRGSRRSRRRDTGIEAQVGDTVNIAPEGGEAPAEGVETGGGGGGRITPVGALVIGRRHAQFVRFSQAPRLLGAIGLGLGLGLLLGRRRR